MFKFHCVFSIFFFLTQNFSAQSQVQGILKYKVIMNDKKVGTTTQERIVYFNNKSSIELAGNSYSNDVDKNDETRSTIVIPSKKPFFIYKNFSNKRLHLSGKVGSKSYLINDTLLSFKWIITKEKQIIQGYNCLKATTQFRGRNYIAWFSDSISIQNGPWKFCGLPGLIIKIYDDKQAFTYELTEMDFKSKFDEKILAIPKEYIKDKPITHKQFMVYYNKKLEDYAKISKVVETSKNGGYGSVSILVGEQLEKY